MNNDEAIIRELEEEAKKLVKWSVEEEAIMEIKNLEELKEELADILLQFDLDCNQYHTNVYLYVEDGIGRLELFVNVGGNSWLNDDHYTIYTDFPHCESILDSYTTQEVLDVLNLTVEDFPEDFDEIDILNEIQKDDDYMQAIKENFATTIDTGYYYDEAENAFDHYFDRIEEE